jgi:hypothetical protein
MMQRRANMRLIYIALIGVLGVPALALGQQRRWEPLVNLPARWELPQGLIAPRNPLPRFTIDPRTGFPVAVPPHARTSRPLPEIGLHHPAGRVHDRDRRGRTFQTWPTQFVVVPWFVPSFVPSFITPMAPAPAPAPAPEAPVEPPSRTGSLFLEVQPGSAQVFVDGYYVGTPNDLNAQRRGLVLESAPHRIDVSAPGYEAVTFDVRIEPNQSLVFRRALTTIEAPPPAQAPAAAPAAPLPPTTFYMIPGCYMGNIPPKDARLPATCDVSRAVTLQF